MRKDGKIAYWNQDKAYGFIQPYIDEKAIGNRVFVHISSFKTHQKTPSVGQTVSFQLAKDNAGRLCAARVMYPTEKADSEQKSNTVSKTVWLTPAYFLLLSITTAFFDLPAVLLWWHIFLSIFTFIAYAFDKSAAQLDQWRTKETTLHTLSVLGGWPGALLAQQLLRHKSRKRSFRISFWVTVSISLLIVLYLHTSDGRYLLQVASDLLATFLSGLLP